MVTFLGHLRWHDRDRIIYICVASPKVAKASSVTCRCDWRYRANHCQWKHDFRDNEKKFYDLNNSCKTDAAQTVAEQQIQVRLSILHIDIKEI